MSEGTITRKIRKGSVERVGFTVVENGDPSGFSPSAPALTIHYPDNSTVVVPGVDLSVTGMDMEYLWDTTALSLLGIYKFCWSYSFDVERFPYEQNYLLQAAC